MATIVGPAPYLSEDDCRLEELIAVLAARTDPADYPHAADLMQEVLVYDAAALRAAIDRAAVQAELVRALTDGPGLVVFRGAFSDLDAVDRVTAAFDAMISDQRAAGATAGDHFATPGANDRVWNALGKLAVRDPDAFVDYYANDILALVSAAWLGAPADALANAVAAAAEGYPFPTNLDRDAPVDGLTPSSQAEIVHRALAAGTDPGALEQEIGRYDRRHSTDED